ncbi:MAG: GNAT family N-acetyltransferase [Rhizobiaceae bacterium]
MQNFLIETGIPDRHLKKAAGLHFEAFSGKVGGILGRDGRGAGFFADIINPAFGICALSMDRKRLLGIAGFKTADGGLMSGELADLQKHYGLLGGLWRGLLLAPLDRPVEDDILLMDGIAVIPEMRGCGVGSALLDEVQREAARRGKANIRLDVIDTNPRAKSLYERKGFVAAGSQSIGPLRHIFGFNSATTMLKPVVM